MTASARALPPPHSVRAWLLAARPATLSAAVVPVAVGTAVAHATSGARVLPALAALAGAVLLQIGTNLANDVHDFEKGADTPDCVGPARAVQSGLLSPAEVRAGTWVVFGLAALTGLYLTTVAGPVVVAIGIASIAAGLAYTGGPYPLGYHGLGDLFVMLFFGLVAVVGTAFVQTGEVSSLALLASVPVGALATAILVVNNLRDRETDARAGKRTLAVRLGRRATVAEYAILVGLAYAIPVMLFLTDRSSPIVLLPLSTLPYGAVCLRHVARNEGRALAPALPMTARLLLAHGLSFAAGIGLS